MRKDRLANPLRYILGIYILCVIFRIIEYMCIRTDESFFGEAFIHKLTGIFVLFAAVKYFSFTWPEIGFTGKKAGKNTLYGLLLGCSVFVLGYGTEWLLQAARENHPSLQFYVTSYAIDGNRGNQTGVLFFALCVAGNMINVVMEEGIFRGLFIRLAEIRYSFAKAVIISSLLFGIWHIAAPLRSLLDGEMSPGGAAMTALILAATTGIAGVKFCLLTRITGSLWMPMADHFVNNTIVNTLHVTTLSGADELQMLRISAAQTVSFLVVLFIYWKSGARGKQTFRP